MSITLVLDDDAETQLAELADMYGLQGTINEIGLTALKMAYDQLLVDSPPEVGHTLPSLTVQDAIDRVVNYNPGVGVAFTGEPIPEAEPEKTFTWEDLTKYAPEDMLVKQALELGTMEQGALTELYNNLPADLWGSLKAAELWKRQISFTAKRNG